jgi:hypothetical protein
MKKCDLKQQYDRHFAGLIVDESPDVVLLQEVRFDTGFAVKLKHTKKATWSNPAPIDVGSQVEHLLHYISVICAEREMEEINGGCHNANQMYQVVYQPAMLLQEV